MIGAIIFDCFGVLAEDGWTPFKRRYISGNTELESAIRRLGKEVDSGEREYDNMIYETARLTRVDEAEVRKAVEHRVPNTALFAYIEAELKPKYKIGMLSNASYNVLKHLFTPEQTALFDATVLSYEAGLVKPDPDMYNLAAERLGTDVEHCIVVDDQERHIEGARSAGMQAVLYTDVEALKQELAQYL
jgi:HAD superfamily hydrolase (TIGR01509 family)